MSHSRWYVLLKRRSNDSYHVSVRQLEGTGLSPATLEADFSGVEPLRQLLDMAKPYRMVVARISAGPDDEIGLEMLDVPEGEDEAKRKAKVESDLLGVPGSSRYAAIGPDWETMAQRFEAWRPKPGIRKVMVNESCKNPACGKEFRGFAEIPENPPPGYLGKSVHCPECGSAVSVIATQG